MNICTHKMIQKLMNIDKSHDKHVHLATSACVCTESARVS